MNQYLQHLIQDPTFGKLFPHRLAIAAYGVPNEYQLVKHRPRLVEGHHYVKIRGADHVERLFYTLTGLILLADLVNTPQAQQFKQALIQHSQPAGAIVQQPQMPLPTVYGYPAATAAGSQMPMPPTAYDYPAAATTGYRDVETAGGEAYARTGGGLSVASQAALVAQFLQPGIAQAVETAVSARLPEPQPPQTPQDAASMIFQAQQLLHDSLLAGQNLVANQRPTVHIHNSSSPSWLQEQDAFASTLVTVGVLCLASIAAYFFLGLMRPQPPAAPPQPASFQSESYF